jgi:carboxypeptidase PM20D1
MRKLFIALLLLLSVMLAVTLVKTFSFKSRQNHFNVPGFQTQSSAVVKEKALKIISQALKIKTISYDNEKFEKEEFLKFHSFLKAMFPNVFKTAQLRVISDYTLLLKWRGKNHDKPGLLLAHMDVVPVGNANEWLHKPFSGEISDGFIWGRGAIDNKASMVALLFAAEELIKSGFIPDQDLYFGFGHDEEVGGSKGAKKIAEYFKNQKIKLDFVFDEGGLVTSGISYGVIGNIAVVGIAEKGYLNLILTARGEPGHSAQPPRESSIDILSKALVKLSQFNFPAKLDHPAFSLFLNYIGPELNFAQKWAVANSWISRPLLISFFSKSPRMNSMIRTSHASTIINGGFKENVVPSRATANINLRLYPGTSIKKALELVKKTIDDPRVELKTGGENFFEASPVSNINHHVFKKLGAVTKLKFTDAIVIPYLNIAATDSRYFVDITNNIYRFNFMFVGTQDIQGYHGPNERISVDSYFKMIESYEVFIRNL